MASGFILFSVWIFSYSPCKTGFIKHILRYSFLLFFQLSFFHPSLTLILFMDTLFKKGKKKKEKKCGIERVRDTELWNVLEKEEVLEHGKWLPLYMPVLLRAQRQW